MNLARVLLPTGLQGANAIAVDGTNVYWADGQNIVTARQRRRESREVSDLRFSSSTARRGRGP